MELTDQPYRLLEMVRRMARERVAPRAADIDAKDESPGDLRTLFRDAGRLRLVVPEAHGGLREAIRPHDRQDLDLVKLSAMAKRFTTGVAMQVITDAVRVLGGVRVPDGTSDRAEAARRQGRADPGRHQPDPAPAHRPAADQGRLTRHPCDS